VNKYGVPIYDHCCRVFSCLPLCSVLNDKVFVIHGGLGWDDHTLEELDAIDVCVCICIRVCVCVRLCVFQRKKRVCVCESIRVYICVCMCVCVCVCVCV
jgi:hypothetical protein